ncbi:MAG: HAMP domain-containing histidine kinase [Mogibacterium sp.]|nr:HAMP domain-containing histidine kinase [Mogibacterium sp.]
MSSNPKSSEQKKMTSITRELHWYWIRRKLLRFLLTDLAFFILACVGWCADQEYSALGTISLENSRRLFSLLNGHDLFYMVTSPDGAVLLQVSATIPFLVILTVAGGIFLLQLIGQLPAYFREDRKIRRILSPINEVALKADELSRLSFSEGKYEEIEKALENIQPDWYAENQPLSFQDSDLSGVEAAMNNLLLRMRDAYRQQARFVNDASHELRTPIAVIQGYANLLDRWGKSDPQILEEGIAAIKNEADQMNHLVEQLLFLARGDSGKTTLELAEVNLCDLIREVCEESSMIDEAHSYHLRVPEQPIVVTADPGLLKQAVRILTDNAAKYTNTGDEIILSAGVAGAGEYYLQVQDTGVGIAGSEIPHIFERFYRSDEVRSSAGTGLGLSIAKWVVDKHNGRFEVLSRPQLGTRIRIILPEQVAS